VLPDTPGPTSACMRQSCTEFGRDIQNPETSARVPHRPTDDEIGRAVPASVYRSAVLRRFTTKFSIPAELRVSIRHRRKSRSIMKANVSRAWGAKCMGHGEPNTTPLTCRDTPIRRRLDGDRSVVMDGRGSDRISIKSCVHQSCSWTVTRTLRTTSIAMGGHIPEPKCQLRPELCYGSVRVLPEWTPA
jgi:hypothetical protein